MGILESVDLEVLDLGESPVRLGGMKVTICPTRCSAMTINTVTCSLPTFFSERGLPL